MVNQLIPTSMLVTNFLAIHFVLPVFERRHFTDYFMMFYYQVCAVLGFQSLRLDTTHFDVYLEAGGNRSDETMDPQPAVGVQWRDWLGTR